MADVKVDEPSQVEYMTEGLKETFGDTHWKNRKLMFSKFDEGIQMPDQGDDE